MNKEDYREAFTEAMKRAEEALPDSPIVMLVSAVMQHEDGTVDFPCAVGGRNLDLMGHEPTAILSSLIRTVFEMCLELANSDYKSASEMFFEAMKLGFGLDIEDIHRVSIDRDTGPRSEEDKVKDILLRKIQEMF